MKFSSEIKVGLSIIVAVIAFVLGMRFFKDVPLFKGTYPVYTQIADAKGLIPGNPVRLNGVKVGSVGEVRYEQANNLVHVGFRVNNDITLPLGTTCTITGIDALTGVRVELQLGPADNEPIEPGGHVPVVENGQDLASSLLQRAPVIADRVDSVLVGLEGTIVEVHAMLREPNSDLRQSMSELRGGAAELGGLLRDERDTISRILANVDTVSSDLAQVTSLQGDSVAMAISRLNTAMASMEMTMSSLQSTTARLDQILLRVDEGSGTLGMLINDPSLYVRLDSVVTNLDLLVSDFRRDPRKYLREMKIVDIF